jgi:hypothetical protein
MVSRRSWLLASAVIVLARFSCHKLLVPGTSKQTRTLRTGRREQIPGRTRTVQEQTLPEELELRARTLRHEASLAEAALAATRASRAQQESAYEQFMAPVCLNEEDHRHRVACTRESTKPAKLSPPRSEALDSSIISRFAACLVVATFWVFVTAGWYAIAASTFYSAANDHRTAPVVHGLNHSIRLIE